MNSNNISNTNFGKVINHCRQLLITQFTNSKVEFNRRQTNSVTHGLTQTTPLETNSQIYIGVVPCIHDFYLNKFCPLEKIRNQIVKEKIKLKSHSR